MEVNQIERHFNNGEFTQALKGLAKHPESHWRDTARLRCFRALGNAKQALDLADELHENLIEGLAPYTLNTTENNNQLRHIALIYAECGQAQKACVILHALCENTPSVAALHREYAFALESDERLDLAEKHLSIAIELQPDNAYSHAQLGRILCQSGRVDYGHASYSKALTLEPDTTQYLEQLVYWGNFSERTIQQSNYQLARLWANKTHPNTPTFAASENFGHVDRQLRIGFVATDFSAHHISFFAEPLLEGLDKKQFYTAIYSDTRRTRKSNQPISDLWRTSSKLDDSQLATLIAADNIDILIDLNGHTSGNRLGVFAKHAAPLQASWLGYPSTTGLHTIAYRITDRVADPAGLHEDFFTEAPLRLPSGFLCSKPPEAAPNIAPSATDGKVRFGSFNNVSKISSLTLDAWSAALNAVPESTLYVKHEQLKHSNSVEFFKKQFYDRGITSDRLVFKASCDTLEHNLAEYNTIDIALDTSPYNGITTTLESLWMGVPVISLMGQTHASRISASILRRVNLSNLATKSIIEFSSQAKKLASSASASTRPRLELRERVRHSPLMQNTQFAHEFGNALRAQWKLMCQKHTVTKGANNE